MKTQCQQCTAKFKVPPKYYGKRIKCPKCKGPVNVPAVDATQPDAPVPSPPVATPTPSSVPVTAPAPSEKLKIACGNCQATLKAPPSLIGKKIACPRCKTPIEVSAPLSSPPTAPQTNAPTQSEKIKIACENCAATLKVPSTLTGTNIPCPRCKQPIALTPAEPTAETEIGQTESPTKLENQAAIAPVVDNEAGVEPPVAEPPVAPPQGAAESIIANDQLNDGDEANESLSSSDDFVDRKDKNHVPRESFDTRRRRSNSAKAGRNKLMVVVSGMIVGLGTLLVAAALYIYFFGGPGQTAAAPAKPESQSVAKGLETSTDSLPKTTTTS